MFKGYGSEEFQESLLRMEEVLTPKRFKTSSTMKKLTNKQKIAILKKMRANLNGPKSRGGFCLSYIDVTGENIFIDESLDRIKELGLRPPKKVHSRGTHGMWYPEYDPIRLRIIDQLIKRLSK